ncbi:MAG: fused MFS/spermidine synthase [Verrucomicrobia bacterium]|nr:fused MFS/spermidine synthase [Verrucomicrobiota bacterium]
MRFGVRARRVAQVAGVAGVLFAGAAAALAAPWHVVFEATSPYHHIRVIDEDGMRVLSFDGSTETQMSLSDPLRGHFEYTEYFHLVWLWQSRLSNVLMIGLGGASVQRAYAHYYPEVTVETVELDPTVVQVARDYFHFKEGPKQKVRVEDGRVFVRRTTRAYDAIVIDAYTAGRYGSFIPYHLATREFFELARRRLGTNGVVAYNVIGSLRGYQADILGAVYRTLNAVFPRVYLFPARESDNVVLVATCASQPVTLRQLQRRADAIVRGRRVSLPGFRTRVAAFRSLPPSNAHRSPVLTDDYAPVDGLLSGRTLRALEAAPAAPASPRPRK